MPLTAAQIVTLAGQTAKTPGFTSQAGQFLNTVLADLCQNYDLDTAKLSLNFSMPTATRQISNFNASLASGPIYLPPNYLRTKKGDVMWFQNGLPIYMVPIDLEQFDLLPQMAGLMSFPTFWATDMSQPQIQTETAATFSSNTTLSALLSTAALYQGAVVVAPGMVPPNTTVAAILGPTSVQLSQAALVTATGATAVFQQPPLAYVWPPVSGGLPTLVRYYSQVADIVTPESSNAVPWFPNQQYLIDKTSARLMQLAGDDRWLAMDQHCDNELRKYLVMKDDSADRAKTVSLDPRRFGRSWGSLPASKTYGF